LIEWSIILSNLSLLGQLDYLLRGSKKKISLIAFFFLFSTCVDLAGVVLIGPFIAIIMDPSSIEKISLINLINSAINPGDIINPIFLMSTCLVVVFAVKLFVGLFSQRMVYKFSFYFRAQLVKKLIYCYFSLPYSYFLGRNLSEMINAVNVQTKTVTDDFLLPLLRSLSNFLFLFIFLIFLIYLNVFAVLLLIGIVGISSAIYYFKIKPIVKVAGEVVAVEFEKVTRGVSEGIKGIREIRVLGVEKSFIDFVGDAADKTAKYQTIFYGLLEMPRYLMEFSLILFIVIFTVTSILLGLDSQVLFPILAMMGLAGLRILPAISQLSSAIASMSYSRYSLTLLINTLESAESLNPTESARIAIDPSGGDFLTIELSNVSFTYPGSNRRSIRNASFKIVKGQSIGLIGGSGSGKSTLADILLGLHSNISGEFRIDGILAANYGWKKLQGMMAYIPQSVFLIDESIEKNIAFGIPAPQIDQNKMGEVVRAAQLNTLLSRLPDGLKTRVGDGGARLSGGERQRIAIARALYQDRQILILDEATSSLDNETEKEITKIIHELKGTKTLIVIAHRLETLSNSDLIMRLRDGVIVESGTYGEVVKGLK
jgi:ABC-type multidrug transport system fused ATPase/permease subunit